MRTIKQINAEIRRVKRDGTEIMDRIDTQECVGVVDFAEVLRLTAKLKELKDERDRRYYEI